MSIAPKNVEMVPVGRIFLYLQNPRHEPFESEAKAIEYLCNKESVFPLARDIAKHGLNPLERFALLPIEKRKSDRSTATYYAAEGNRRVCAIKLLNDPDLAPASLRKSFEKLAQEWTPIKSVSGVVFDALEDVRVWLDRVHAGLQGGVGRKEWNSEQKARFDGENKNRSAQQLLDYAEREKMITPAERARKLTTVQRFVSNDVFSEFLGIDQTDPDEISRTRPKSEFDILVKRFMRDLVEQKDVHSRMNKTAIIAYTRTLVSLAGVTARRMPAEALSVIPAAALPHRERRKTPKRPEKATHVEYQDEIFTALRSLGNRKLESLYHSITSIELDPHCPIIAVGAWSFFETLTSCAGRSATTNFEAFLNKGKLTAWGFQGETVSYRSALGRILEYGNTTKHHSHSATFNGDQLNNDITTLKDIILKCIEEAAKDAVKGRA